MCFVGLHLYSEENNELHFQHNSSICIHIYLTTLADGTYELELDNEEGSSEAHVNRVEITEDPNSTSEET